MVTLIALAVLAFCIAVILVVLDAKREIRWAQRMEQDDLEVEPAEEEPRNRRIAVGLRSAVDGVGFTRDLPYLRYAEFVPAHTTRVDWAIGETEHRNWTQIVRFPMTFLVGTDMNQERNKTLRRMLEVIEQTVRYGVPNKGDWESHIPQTCGGTEHYLGRPLQVGDRLQVCLLRDLELLVDRGDDGAPYAEEFLIEFSVRVWPR